MLERGKFDGLFIADVLGIYDVLNGNGDAAIRQATQVPVNDPLALITPMALVTEHLGFGLTASLSFEHPYPFARRLSTLDHLTKGRVGWNIVTSYLESGARNIGHQAQTDHDARYDYADEYLDVVYKLLEGSWEDGAVLRDRERGIFSDPQKFIRSITRATSSPCRGSTSANPRRSARRCFIRPVPPAAVNSLPPVTPSAFLSPRRRKCCSKRRWRIFAAAPPKPDATRAAF